jgi:hypothetical protein
VQVLNSSLKVEFLARRHPQQQRQIHLVASFSNATSQPLNDLHFQVAVEKVSLSLAFSSFQYQVLIKPGIHITPPAAVRPRHRPTPSKRRTTGNAHRRHRHGQGQLSENPLPSVVPAGQRNEGGAGDGPGIGNSIKTQTIRTTN